MTKPPRTAETPSSFGLMLPSPVQLPALPPLPEGMPGADLLGAWPAYAVDAWQRSVLFLDVMRRRGNAFLEHAESESPHVLSFEFDVVMDGRSLKRPVNYWMARIHPPRGQAPDPQRRPFMVVDPRAGHGPGIGGFKADSEIGVAMKAGHPCYFVGFRPEPEPGQSIEDIVHALVAFVQAVAARHPEAEGLPCSIGNCQAGWALMMAAATAPHAFGPLIIAGSPISYWAGQEHVAPMRYLGGLLGGSWLAALSGDLGAGKFDGAHLVSNFEALNPANTFWSKQYNLWAKVDQEADRYLGFERWWGGHVMLNAGEMQFIVDQLFVGNRLATAELTLADGTPVDLRAIRSPIGVFCSKGDDITPPAQALSWISDLYASALQMQGHGQTIVYAVHESIGHLGIFVSASVAKKEHAEFASNMDLIDVLPPGLYEAVLRPKTGEPGEELVAGDHVLHFEPREVADLAVHGGTSPDDTRRFAAVRRLSEANLALYRRLVQPMIKAAVLPVQAEWLRQMHPARLSYTAFADRNPFMAWVGPLAEMIRADRRPVAEDNPGRQLERQVSSLVERALDGYRDARDAATEKLFQLTYDSALLQAVLGLDAEGTPPRRQPAISLEHRKLVEMAIADLHGRIGEGGLRAAAVRAMLHVGMADPQPDERSFALLRRIRESQGGEGLTLGAFKTLLRDQFFMLLIDEEAALAAIPAMLPAESALRAKALSFVRAVLSAKGSLTEEGERRMARVAALFGVNIDEPAQEPEAPPPPAPRRRSAKAAAADTTAEASPAPQEG